MLQIFRKGIPTDPMPERQERDEFLPHAPVRTHGLNEDEEKVGGITDRTLPYSYLGI